MLNPAPGGVGRADAHQGEVHLEGRIYHPGAPQLTTQLSDLAHLIFTPKLDPRPGLARWLLRTAGDFLLVLVHKADGGIAVINDVFGRSAFNHQLSAKTRQ